MLAIHDLLTNVITLYLAICAGWGLLSAARNRPASASYRATLLIAEGLLVAQTLIGLEFIREGREPREVLHYLYGVLGIAVLPIVLGYVGEGRKRESLWLGLTALFLVGVAIRARVTGGL